jgi:hypothetical protein
LVIGLQKKPGQLCRNAAGVLSKTFSATPINNRPAQRSEAISRFPKKKTSVTERHKNGTESILECFDE